MTKEPKPNPRNQPLHNTLSPEDLLTRRNQTQAKQILLTFYRYTNIPEPQQLRDDLYVAWSEMGVTGRIYVAQEGINAQLQLPESRYKDFCEFTRSLFPGIPIKSAVDNGHHGFKKLTIKVKKQIVADGLTPGSYDLAKVGNHLDAAAFNDALKQPGSICIDMRNGYESEVGHFEGAICPDAATFREELPQVLEMLQGKQEQKVLLYCTGGIRCEKASAYLRHHGFADVNQLEGGIVRYAEQVREEGLDCLYKGRNFVFDERMSEAITDHVIAHCHTCSSSFDRHRNCANDACHRLFIQCPDCETRLDGCCSESCQQVLALPIEEQKQLCRSSDYHDYKVFKSRRRLGDSVKQEAQQP